MSSIKSSLVKQLTLIISIILFLVLLFLDISVDTYVERQFESALVQEGKRLINHIDVENGKISLSLRADLMEEFSAQRLGKYYKIWADNEVIVKSDSLSTYPNFKVPDVKLKSNEYLIKSIELPDGRSGRIFIYNVGNAKYIIPIIKVISI